jgi:hypothetical protein
LVPVTLIASSVETQDEADATPIKLAGGDTLVVAPSVFTIHPGQSIALSLQFSIASSGRLRFLLRLNLGFSLKRRCWAVVFNGSSGLGNDILFSIIIFLIPFSGRRSDLSFQ